MINYEQITITVTIAGFILCLALSTNTKLKHKHGATTQSSQENSTKGTSYSSGQLGQSHGAAEAKVGGSLHRQDEGVPQRVQANNTIRAKT